MCLELALKLSKQGTPTSSEADGQLKLSDFQRDPCARPYFFPKAWRRSAKGMNLEPTSPDSDPPTAALIRSFATTHDNCPLKSHLPLSVVFVNASISLGLNPASHCSRAPRPPRLSSEKLFWWPALGSDCPDIISPLRSLIVYNQSPAG